MGAPDDCWAWTKPSVLAGLGVIVSTATIAALTVVSDRPCLRPHKVHDDPQTGGEA